MKAILKYPISGEPEQTIQCREVARVIHVGVQDNKPFVWVEEEMYSGLFTQKKIYLYPTGGPAMIDDTVRYCGTFQLPSGFVGHVYEDK